MAGSRQEPKRRESGGLVILVFLDVDTDTGKQKNLLVCYVKPETQVWANEFFS